MVCILLQKLEHTAQILNQAPEKGNHALRRDFEHPKLEQAILSNAMLDVKSQCINLILDWKVRDNFHQWKINMKRPVLSGCYKQKYHASYYQRF